MSKLSSIYAQSLFELSLEENAIKEILQDVKLLQDIFSQSLDLGYVLACPTITKEEKESLLDTLFKGEINQYMLNTLKLISDKHHTSEIIGMLNNYEEMHNDHFGIQIVHATTAIPMNEVMKNKLSEKLEHVTGKRILLENNVDPTCIGGIVLNFKDNQYNDSIKNKLKLFKDELANI